MPAIEDPQMRTATSADGGAVALLHSNSRQFSCLHRLGDIRPQMRAWFSTAYHFTMLCEERVGSV